MWSVWQTCRTGRRLAGFLGGLLVALLLAAGPAAAQEVDFTVLEKPLSGGGGAITPAVALSSSSGQAYFAWVEGGEIYFNRSRTASQNSCGAAAGFELETGPGWPMRLSDGSGTASLPALAANGNGGVFVAWQVTAFPANPAIYFKRSLNHGGAFQTTAVKLSQDASSATFPAVAADGADGVFVAWQDDEFNFTDFSKSKSSVVVAQSTDGGETLPRVTVFSAGCCAFFQPAVASDGSRVHVVWNDVSLLGVWYKGFVRGSDASTASAQSLTTAMALYPKIGVYASQVTAAWVELIGSRIKARTMPTLPSGQPFGGEVEIYSSTKSVSNLSLSLGDAGRFFAWQEAGVSTSEIRYFHGSGPDRTLFSGTLEANLAAPSAGQHGTERFVASWQQNGTGAIEVRAAYSGSSGGPGGGGSMRAKATTDPAHVNARTMAKGTSRQPNLTVFLEPAEGEVWSASAIVPSSVKMNGKPALGPTSLVGNRRMVKFDRNDLLEDGSYTITGEIAGQSCPFSYSGQVTIRP